ncbi:conjugal transfer protein TraI [Orientia tsutsugamushi]|uniref:Conjugal transfer protein TraI n=1 Tax=Orientia tsutsugamushi TaxID=784 RepID=A0A2U3RTA0_ORITS|nr:hypothetical protein [Orientia tsutsugamushi]KJV54540.1 hypothetical protein OTSKARP_1063 [Orientia tsutsugamushi str. Karp]KJV76278.1 hypothetical protein OTSUT76_2570 [Orientia tsutsugamushi str. UT76]SPR08847.1 conjugal transfer protein TraI [Orientia tsutsugamushi]SPR16443.1 conjugal transfer protein TraI [Orientia tsutsugamushi]
MMKISAIAIIFYFIAIALIFIIQGLYAVRNIISPEIRKLNEKIESIQTNIQPGLCPKH